MKQTILILVLVISTFLAKSQANFDKRIELELKDGYEDETIHPFGENGFLMSSRSEKVVDNEIEWKFDQYNTDLELSNSYSMHLDKKFRLFASSSTFDKLYSFFYYRGEFTIVTVEVPGNDATIVKGELPKKLYIYDMWVLGEYVYFNAYLHKAPQLFAINWRTGKQKLTPLEIEGCKPKSVTISNIQPLDSAGELMVFVYSNAKRGSSKVGTPIAKPGKGNKMHAFIFDKEGEFLNKINFSDEASQKISSISGYKVGENQYIFAGTYSHKAAGLSEGLFFCKVEGKDVKYFQTYNFLDLKNFLNYLPDKMVEKIERKKERKNSKGKEMTIQYRIAGHDIIVTPNGYMFLGEAYYPTYYTRTYTTTSTTSTGTTTTTHTEQVFDGFQYTHAVLVNFDSEGKIVWDQCFEMWPAYKPFYVKKFISLAQDNEDAINMVFVSKEQICSKSIDYSGKVIKDDKSQTIKTTYEGDKTKYSYSNLDYWYGNYFIAYGEQKIKNKESSKTKKVRKVFFVNKIGF